MPRTLSVYLNAYLPLYPYNTRLLHPLTEYIFASLMSDRQQV